MTRLIATGLISLVAVAVPDWPETPPEPDAKWREHAGVETLAETDAPPIYREHTVARRGDANNNGELTWDDVVPLIRTMAVAHGDEQWAAEWYRWHLGGNPHVIDLNFDGRLTIHDAAEMSVLLDDPEAYWKRYGRKYSMDVAQSLRSGLINEREAIDAMNYAFSTMNRGAAE